jgi:hypothetical protein
MDKFKEHMNHNVGVGGIHCECCNPYHGKDKKFLNRLARTKLKEETRKEIEAE